MTDHIPPPPPDHTEDVPGFVHDTQRHYYAEETMRAYAERLHAARINGPAIMQAIGLLAVLQSWIGPRRPQDSEPEEQALWDQINATRIALTPLAPAAAPTTLAAPQPADEDKGMTREQWIEQAMRVYLIAGDAEDDARECAKALCGEQNWDPLQDDLADPYDAAMSDVEGRGQAPQPAVQQMEEIDAAVEKAWDRFQAALDKNEPLPPPSVHAAAHYGTWLGREAHRHDEPKAGAFRNAARMLSVLEAEIRRLHAELIATHHAAPAAQGDALLSLAEKHGRVLIERCRVGSINGPLRWGIEYGYDDEIASGSTLLAAIDAARSQAKEGGAA